MQDLLSLVSLAEQPMKLVVAQLTAGEAGGAVPHVPLLAAVKRVDQLLEQLSAGKRVNAEERSRLAADCAFVRQEADKITQAGAALGQAQELRGVLDATQQGTAAKVCVVCAQGLAHRMRSSGRHALRLQEANPHDQDGACEHGQAEGIGRPWPWNAAHTHARTHARTHDMFAHHGALLKRPCMY